MLYVVRNIIYTNGYKKIALLLSGNLRQFFRNNFLIAKMYSDLVKKQNIDVFIYTDNNDFFYNFEFIIKSLVFFVIPEHL